MFLSLVFATIFVTASAQKDSIVDKKKEARFTYHWMSIDVSKLAMLALTDRYKVVEIQYTTNLKSNIWARFEAGQGRSKVANEYLTFNSSNTFARIGIDKSLFNPEFLGDYSNGFVGLRYGISKVNRGAADYTITDPFWGQSQGNIASTSFFAHWVELTGGFNFEIKKNVYAGWQIRFKTFINPKQFELLPPNYLAGYGKADQATAFSYNLYLGYGFGKR